MTHESQGKMIYDFRRGAGTTRVYHASRTTTNYSHKSEELDNGNSSRNETEQKHQSLPHVTWQSVGFFGIPWLLFVSSIYIVLPTLDRAGVPLFLNFLISLGIPLGLLILASCLAYQQERQPWTWNAFRDRFRLGDMKPSSWVWATGLSIFMLLAPGFLSFSSVWILRIAPVPAPLLRMFDIQPQTFTGLSLTGSWWVLLGYWELIALFPGCLALAFVAYKSKSTWLGIMAHFAQSLSDLVFIVNGVLS